VKKSRELLVAGFGGVVATGLDLALLVFMVGHHVPVPTATFIAALTGAAANFVVNKYVAFRDRSPINMRQLARFQLVSIVTALLMAAAMQLVAVRLGVPVLFAKLGCAAVLFALWSYPAQRRLVFTRGAAA
jgi:putative flippase GtrA